MLKLLNRVVFVPDLEDLMQLQIFVARNRNWLGNPLDLHLVQAVLRLDLPLRFLYLLRRRAHVWAFDELVFTLDFVACLDAVILVQLVDVQVHPFEPAQ